MLEKLAIFQDLKNHALLEVKKKKIQYMKSIWI